MPNDVDFDGIGRALASYLEANITASWATRVIWEPNAIDFRADNTPLITIMLADGQSNPRAGQSYYDQFRVELEISAIDLSNWADAVSRRNEIFRQCRGLIRANPRFHVDVNEAKLGSYEFERAVDSSQEGWYAAICRFEVIIGVYYDI